MEGTLRVLNTLEERGTITRYAIGGAFALLFYTEPMLTYDVDVFVFLAEQKTTGLVDLAPLYRALQKEGYLPEREHVVVEGVPVQFIPAYNALVTEAVNASTEKEYKGIRTRVLTLEYLLAIMTETNRPKDRARLVQLAEEAMFDRAFLRTVLNRYGLLARWEACCGTL